MTIDNGTTQTIFSVLIAFGALGVILYKSYARRHKGTVVSNTPILLSYYTDGSLLVAARQGKFGDMHFSAFVATNFNDLSKGMVTGLVFRVELPFQSSIHLMGIPKKGSEAKLDPTQRGSLMERVELEGDYNQYFDLFCEKGMQADARYVLDPKAMLFTLDFCQSQSWEVVGNELYFVQTGANQDDDPTPLTDDIVTFVREIKPSVALPLTDEQRNQVTPYGQDRRTDLHCPICSKLLTNTDHYFICPANDGILLTGARLAAASKGKLKLPDMGPGKTVSASRKLVCPSCGNQMEHVAYDGGSTMIDSCSNCAYRWLDANEFSTLGNNSRTV